MQSSRSSDRARRSELSRALDPIASSQSGARDVPREGFLARSVVVVATSRPLVAAAMSGALGARGSFAVEVVDLDVSCAHQAPVVRAAAIVVDVEQAPAIALRFCQEVRACRPAEAILALLCCPEGPKDFHLRALRAIGIGGVVSLDSSTEQVEAAIETVARGDFALYAPLSPSQAAALGLQPDHRASKTGRRGDERPVTERDVELLRMVKEGLSDAEIGSRLNVSASTVKADIGAWCRRAGVTGRVQLAVWAERHRF